MREHTHDERGTRSFLGAWHEATSAVRPCEGAGWQVYMYGMYGMSGI